VPNAPAARSDGAGIQGDRAGLGPHRARNLRLITVWRICKKARLADAFDGRGAAEYPGRWNNPGVAVVYTAESRSLASLEVLKYPNYEVIVVNDGSTDATEALLKTYPTIRLLSHTPNRGKTYALSRGIAAARGDWLMKMPGPMAKRVFAVAVVATFTLFLLALRGGAGFLGGGTWSSALYALWDSTFAVGVSMILVTFFRRYLDSPKKPWEYVSRHSYTVYFIHIPILVTIAAVFLSLIHPGPLAKFVLAAVIVVPLTWAVAGLIRKIPYADRVL
jgi:hypothetical protein